MHRELKARDLGEGSLGTLQKKGLSEEMKERNTTGKHSGVRIKSVPDD